MNYIQCIYINAYIYIYTLTAHNYKNQFTNHAADMAVDWLNDRLYWVDRELRQISEFDLTTGHRSVVLTTGEAGLSAPSAIALYPYPNYG